MQGQHLLPHGSRPQGSGDLASGVVRGLVGFRQLLHQLRQVAFLPAQHCSVGMWHGNH